MGKIFFYSFSGDIHLFIKRTLLTALLIVSIPLQSMATTINGTTAYDYNQTLGWNIHPDRTDGQHQNYKFLKASLRAFKIPYVRSSLNILPGPSNKYANFLQDLDDNDASDAIRSDEIVTQGTSALQIQNLTSIWGVIYYENPNELDASTDTNWITDDINEETQIHNAIQTYHPSITEIAPSVVFADPAQVNSANNTIANMHDYFGYRNPETTGYGGDVYGNGTIYGSELYNMATARRATTSTAQVFSTESGYSTDTGKLTQYTQATYLERTEFVHLMNGISKQFLYEWTDDNQNFGIFNADGSPKLSAFGLLGMHNILYDAQEFTGTCSLGVTITASVPVNSYLLCKSNGEKDLIVWQPTQDQDPDTFVNSIPSSTSTTITLTGSNVVNSYTQDNNFNWYENDASGVSTLTPSISDRISIFAINPQNKISIPLMPHP